MEGVELEGSLSLSLSCGVKYLGKSIMQTLAGATFLAAEVVSVRIHPKESYEGIKLSHSIL